MTRCTKRMLLTFVLLLAFTLGMFVSGQTSQPWALADHGAAGHTNILPDSGGFVIGHTEQIPVNGPAELQVIGTSFGDSGMLFGTWNVSNGQEPIFTFLKSGASVIGNNTVVVDNETLGRIDWKADDGGDFNTAVARISGEVDDAAPAASDIGGALVFSTADGGGTDNVAEKMRLTAAGNLTFGQTTTVSTTTGNLTLGAAGEVCIGGGCP